MRRESSENGKTPTISRVCSDTLIELVYDQEARKTGLAVSRFGGLWNIEAEVDIETGETLVPYSATNNLIASGCVLLPSRPIEYMFKNELVAEIRAFLHRYVDLSPDFETAAAYYVLFTWVHDAFNDVSYLRFRGDFGTGKTRGLLAMGSLCYKGFFASGASTVSPIFHTLDAFGGTLILDEADFAYSDARADIVKLLNNGTTRGMPVLRTMVSRQKEFNPYAFKVFGPKIVAMRGSFDDLALESRFITEETGARSLRNDIPIHLPDSLQSEALVIRNKLLHYRLCHFYEIQTDAAAVLEGASARLNQTAISLLSIIDDAADRKIVEGVLRRENDAQLADRRESTEAKVLSSVIATVADSANGHASVREITQRFNVMNCAEYGAPVTNKWIGFVIRKNLRLATQKSKGVYVIPPSEQGKIELLAKRYGLGKEHEDRFNTVENN